MFLLRYAAAILTVLAGRLTAAENCGMLLAAMWVQSGVAGDFDELWREQCADHGAARPGRAQRCPDAAEASGCGSIRALTRRCVAPLCSLCAGCRRSTRSLCACRSMCGRRAAFVPGWRSGLRDISWPQRSGTGAVYPPCRRRLPAAARSVGTGQCAGIDPALACARADALFSMGARSRGYQTADESRLERQADRCARETLYDYADVYAHPLGTHILLGQKTEESL